MIHPRDTFCCDLGYLAKLYSKRMMASDFSEGDDIQHSSTSTVGQRKEWKARISDISSPLFTRQFLKVLLGGQVISLLICGTAVTSQILQEDHGVNAPTAQSFINYLLLTFVYCGILCFRKEGDNFYRIFLKRGWKYAIIAVIDVEANYLVVMAYQHTTLTSIQMLDCITIPVVLILSFLVLRVRYQWTHITGVLVCLVGLVGLVLADLLTGRSVHGEPSNRLLGDMLCLLGASLYGFSNVAQEYAVRFYTRVEFLGMVGLFATFISGIQLIILERDELTTFNWNVESVFLMIGFGTCMFLLYSLFPLVIKWSSATAVNLSILTADLYSLLFGLFLFHFKGAIYHVPDDMGPTKTVIALLDIAITYSISSSKVLFHVLNDFSVLYIVGYFVIMVGILVYGLKPTYQSLTGIRYRFFRNGQESSRGNLEEDKSDTETPAPDLHVSANTLLNGD